jgi:murein DD-endopeptidase MepM/ murein hydrolase activator NlpD
MKKYSLIGAGVILLALLTMIYVSEREVPQKLARDTQGLWKSLTTFRDGPAPVEYGIDVGDLYLCTDVIKANENLSEILSRNGIPVQVIHELASKSSGVFDPRNIRAGKSYCIMRSTDSLSQVQYFIYEQDPVNYVVYELGDTVSVHAGKKQVVTRSRTAGGYIESSLWNTLAQNDLDPDLALHMAGIYAWTIDFFRIFKGDYFKVLFEEQYVDGLRVGTGTIKGAMFHHHGKDYYAIRFNQDSVPDYFDESANSLKKAFLKAPLEFRRISSGFNMKRFHPILKRRRPHLGTDYAAQTGTPIWSIGNGVVEKAEYNRGQGNYVQIRHNGTYTTKYLHMSKFGAGIRAGAHVSQGQVIGYVGMTGLATGPHLHYEMIKNGQHVDAQNEDVPPGDPIAPDCLESYANYREQIVAMLDAIEVPRVYPVGQAETAHDQGN